MTAAFAAGGPPPPPPPPPAPPSPPPGPPSIAYEVDNGTDYSLASGPIALANSGAGYEDAGPVLNLGPVSNFTGITAKGTSNLAANVWISDGSQAYSPGETPLSSGANFCYGLGQSNPTTGTVTSFYMTGSSTACGTDYAHTISASQVATDFAGYQAYAWVGVDTNGSYPVSGSVTRVNGAPVNATLSLTSITASAQ